MVKLSFEAGIAKPLLGIVRANMPVSIDRGHWSGTWQPEPKRLASYGEETTDRIDGVSGIGRPTAAAASALRWKASGSRLGPAL